MINRAEIARLVPHQGDMCLLDQAPRWSDTAILCHTHSHLAATNPLRRDGRLNLICGCEYGFQAAALHGALLAGGVPQRAGFLAGLRVAWPMQRRLDDPALGMLAVEAELEFADPNGLIYRFRLSSAPGEMLLEGRGTIKLPVLA